MLVDCTAVHVSAAHTGVARACRLVGALNPLQPARRCEKLSQPRLQPPHTKCTMPLRHTAVTYTTRRVFFPPLAARGAAARHIPQSVIRVRPATGQLSVHCSERRSSAVVSNVCASKRGVCPQLALR